MACLDKGVLACLGEGVVECLYEGVVACWDKNNNDNFDVDIRHSIDDCFNYFILAHPLKNILDGTLVGKCIFHHGYLNNGGWY